MGEHEKNKGLIEKKQCILKECDGVKRAQNFLDLLSYCLHEKKNLFDFFQVKKWVFIEFDQGYKNKELIERYKILDQEALYLKKKQMQEGDFAIEQMKIALEDLKNALHNISLGQKKMLLPRVLLKVRPVQLIDDFRALRFLSKIRIRLFDFQKELGALNATISKKNAMFHLFRDFSKQVNLERDDLMSKIQHKVEISLFKEIDKKVCVKSSLIKDERACLNLTEQIQEARAIVDAIRLNKVYAKPLLHYLDAAESICLQSLEKQKQAYLDNKEGQEEKKRRFEQKINTEKDLKSLLQELKKESLYIELKKELENEILTKIAQQENKKDALLLHERQKEKKMEEKNELEITALFKDMEQYSSSSNSKTLDQLKESLYNFMEKKRGIAKRLDCIRFDFLAAKIQKILIEKQSSKIELEEQAKGIQEHLVSYKALKAKSSLAFDEAFELNQVAEFLKENKKLCVDKLGNCS